MKSLLKQFAVLLVVSIVVGSAWLGLSLAQAPFTTVDLNRGAHVFQDRCASCHALDPTQASLYGPSLKGIGASAANRVPSLTAEEYLLQSIIDPNAFRNSGEHGVMPADISSGLDSTDLISLVGFLVQHDGSLNWPRLLALIKHARATESPPDDKVQLAMVEGGKELFMTKAKCGQCHVLQATPGGALRAPSLLSAGQHSTQYLRDSIGSPSQTITQGYHTWSVWLEDGRALSGRLMRSTPDAIDLLTDANGKLRLVSIARDEILQEEDEGEMVLRAPHSMMPDNLTGDLTPAELEQLIAFLQTLK